MWYSCLLRPDTSYVVMCADTASTGQTQGKPEIDEVALQLRVVKEPTEASIPPSALWSV